MPNVVVELTGEGLVVRRITDSKGGLEFTDLPPGRRVLRADTSARIRHDRPLEARRGHRPAPLVP